jgi:steroid delta-isomerase-like uncharacterized protein
MSEANKALIHRWFEEVWNQGRTDVIDELLASDAVSHGITNVQGHPLRSASDFKAIHQQFTSALSDVKVTIHETVAEGDKVAIYCSVQARHGGDGFGVAATHKPVEYTGMGMVRIKDGKIVEAWNSFDFLSLHQQIGLR